MSRINNFDEYQNFNELFLESDSNSNYFQKKFIIFRRIQIISLVTSSFVAIFTAPFVPWSFLALIFISAISSLIIWSCKFDQKWYLWRSIAESVKSASWQYSMSGEKFRPDVQVSDARIEFIDFAKNLILDHQKDVPNIISADVAQYDKNATAAMDKLRESSLQHRAQTYLKYRIKNQKEWYIKKSKNAANLKNIFNAMILTSYLLAGLSIIFDLLDWSIFRDSGTAIGSFLVTIGLALLGWMQIRNYANLETSYRYTAIEIGQLELEFIKEKKNPEFNDEKFSELVQNSEAAFSREHTSWRARKQQI